MKQLFIINPAAGKKTNPDKLKELISQTMSGRGDYEVYLTEAPLDAEKKVRAEAEKGERLRVYAFGGDGTLNECVNGAAGFPNAAITNYPCGSGNDFLRMFGKDSKLFENLTNLIDGAELPMDIIEVCGRKAINICSVGFDARVGTSVHDYTKFPLVSGSFAYILSLIVNLIRGVNNRMTIRINGEELSGCFALSCACNGSYYGGGFNPVPEAEPDDGLLDILVVRAVSRLKFLRLVGKYAKGRYRELGEQIIHYRCTRAEFEGENEMPVNIDGECLMTARPIFSVIPGGVRFIVPSESKFAVSRAAKQAESSEN